MSSCDRLSSSVSVPGCSLKRQGGHVLVFDVNVKRLQNTDTDAPPSVCGAF